MIPNLKYVVQQVRDSKHWPFRSKMDLCAYAQACIRALHSVDPNFGNLVKAEAQNHCKDSQGRRHAVDVALWKPAGQIIDFIASGGFEPDPNLPEPENKVAWGLGPEYEYPESSWFAPDISGPIPGPVDPPVSPVDPELPKLIAKVAALETVVEANKTRMDAINTRFDNESKENVKKPLPDYVGTFRVFGFNFTLVSRPR